MIIKVSETLPEYPACKHQGNKRVYFIFHSKDYKSGHHKDIQLYTVLVRLL